MKPRLYIPPEALGPPGLTLVLDASMSHYLCQVLRLKKDDSVQIFDGVGNRFDSTVLDASKRRAVLASPSPIESRADKRANVTLIQGVARGDRMDWVIEKCSELGVTSIVPLLAERSSVRLNTLRSTKRRAHWERVAQAACMQCGLDFVPTIATPCSLDIALESLQGHASSANCRVQLIQLSASAEQSLTAWTQQDFAKSVARADQSISIILIVGPESGFSTSEDAKLRDVGAVSVSLGPRILRTETAGVVALSILQGLVGDLR